MLLETITSQSFGTKGSAPGNAVLIKTEAGADQEREIELYHPPGVSSGPTPEDRVVEVIVGSGVRVAVATHNYRVEVEPDTGETVIYSTDSEGSAVAARINLTADGDIEINGNDKSFVTYTELNTALQTLVTSINAEFATINTAAAAAILAGGYWLTALTTGANTLDMSAAETTTVKTGG